MEFIDNKWLLCVILYIRTYMQCCRQGDTHMFSNIWVFLSWYHWSADTKALLPNPAKSQRSAVQYISLQYHFFLHVLQKILFSFSSIKLINCLVELQLYLKKIKSESTVHWVKCISSDFLLNCFVFLRVCIREVYGNMTGAFEILIACWLRNRWSSSMFKTDNQLCAYFCKMMHCWGAMIRLGVLSRQFRGG